MAKPTTTQQGYGAPWQRLRRVILARDHYRCHWCGRLANSVDHVTPKAAGGGDQFWNLVASCTPCNSRRGMEWVRTHRRGGLPRGVRQRGASPPQGALAEGRGEARSF